MAHAVSPNTRLYFAQWSVWGDWPQLFALEPV